MTDAQILTALAEKCGGIIALAEELKITRQTAWDWSRRGISKDGRYKVLFLAKEKRIKLPSNFINR